MSKAGSEETVTLNVLTVASSGNISGTEPLRVSAPCQFSNAKGNLRTVESVEEVRSIARESAQTLKSVFGD